jgi:hypothetical protein
VAQIALVSDQHDDNVGIGVVPELLQPSRDVLVGLVLADIVDEEGTDGTTVVGRGDGAISLLTGCVPDLCLDGLGVDLDRSCGKLDADRRLGVQVELISGESTEQVGLSDARISDQDDYTAAGSVSRQRRIAAGGYGGAGPRLRAERERQGTFEEKLRTRLATRFADETKRSHGTATAWGGAVTVVTDRERVVRTEVLVEG